MRTASFDVLSETLRQLRLTGSVFLSARFTEPFGVVSPRRFDPDTPLAHLRHISIFHLVAAGGCTIELADGSRRSIEAGEVLLLPLADAHKFWKGDRIDMAFAPDLMRNSPVNGMWTLDYGGGGAETRMVCGFLESAELMFAPVFRSLPTVLVGRIGDGKLGALLTSTVREILTLADAATPGTEVLLGRLMELLFVEVIRHHVAQLPPSATGWFAALNEPIVGKALQLVHSDPVRRWTVEDLAREVGTSRSVLGERFQAVLGQPPISYVAGWRMQLAADRLRHGKDSIASVAAAVGYESEAAFNRAFKRLTGVTPGAWRDAGSGRGLPSPLDGAASR